MKTDVQIAQEAVMKPIQEIADQLGIVPEAVEPYGRYKAKIDRERNRASWCWLLLSILPRQERARQRQTSDFPWRLIKWAKKPFVLSGSLLLDRASESREELLEADIPR